MQDNTQLLLQIQETQRKLEESEFSKEERRKKNLILYGSIAFNGMILIVILFLLLGGWTALLIAYALIATGGCAYLLYRLINTVNDYKDILEGQAQDNQQMIGNLAPFLREESAFTYSDEIKQIVGTVNAYAKRMQARQEELLGGIDQEEMEEKPKQKFWNKLSIYKEAPPEPPNTFFGSIPIGGSPGQGTQYRNGQ